MVREKVRKFIGAEFISEVIFTSGTTEGINLVARGWGENNLKEGDEIVLTEAEHHSNLVPWQELAKRNRLKLKFIEGLQISDVRSQIEQKINKKTKLLAINHVSNVLGTINPIKEIIAAVKKINPEICVLVDGAQAIAHIPVNVKEMDCDFYVFSGHKMYGPTGVGVLYAKAKRQLELEPINYGGGMIGEVDWFESSWADGVEKYEAGTPPIAQVIGLGAALDFIGKIGMSNIEAHEKELIDYALDKLEEIDEILVINENRQERVGVISIVSKVTPGHDLGYALGLPKRNICVRSGLHCAGPLHKKLGQEYGTTRISFGIYNTKEDIDKLVKEIREIQDIFISIEEH